MVIGGSVVECLTWDRGFAGSSLTGGTALFPLGKTFYPLLSTGWTQEDPSWHDCKIVDWDGKDQKKLVLEYR